MIRRLLVPGLSTLAMLAILLGLGTWQVQRLRWKLGLLAAIDAAERAPGVPLPPAPSPFAKVHVEGRLRGDLAVLYAAETHDTPPGPVLGAQLIEPLERPGAVTVLVDRGWVPMSDGRNVATSGDTFVATSGGTVVIDGFVHPADKPGWFSAADDPAGRHFFTLDPQAIGAALGLREVAPFVLVAMGPPGAVPGPAQHLPRPPNNHLSYAITWYGLAVVLLVIFVLYVRKVLRA